MTGQEQDREALARVLRASARKTLRLNEGDYWPYDVAEQQADAVLASDWLAEVVRQAEQRGYERGTTDGVLAAGSGADQ